MSRVKHLAPFLITASATAQGFLLFGANQLGNAPAETPYIKHYEHAWQGWTVPSGAVTKCLPAAVTANGLPDCVALMGGKMVVMTAPGIHTQASLLPLTGSLVVNDFAVLNGLGLADASEPTQDALALATPVGLKVWRVDDQGAMQLTDLHPSWTDIMRIAVHPGDPNSIFGVNRDGQLSLLHFASGSVTETSHLGGGSVLDMECVDWDGDGETEVVVLTADNLRVYTRNPLAFTELYAFNNPVAGIHDLTRIRPYGAGPGVVAEMFGWLHANSNVIEIHGGGLPVRTVALPQGHSYVAIAGCRALATEDCDALYLTRANQDAITVLGQGPGRTFLHDPGAGYQIAVAQTGSCAPTQCSHALADFDADGDCDIMAVLPPTGSVTIGVHRLFTPKFYHRTLPWQQALVDDDPDENRLQFSVPGVVGTWTQVSVWEVDVNGAIGVAPVAQPALQFCPAGGATHEYDIAANNVLLNEGGDYAILVRPVLVDQGQITVVGEASLYSVIAELSPLSVQDPIILSRMPIRGRFPPPPPGSVSTGR